jgi:hypothetical protein
LVRIRPSRKKLESALGASRTEVSHLASRGEAFMRERKPFNLYERGGIWHARFWDEQERRYSITKSTECSERDEAVVAATRMIEDGTVRPRSADPLVLELCLDYWRTSKKNITAKYRGKTSSAWRR